MRPTLNYILIRMDSHLGPLMVFVVIVFLGIVSFASIFFILHLTIPGYELMKFIGSGATATSVLAILVTNYLRILNTTKPSSTQIVGYVIRPNHSPIKDAKVALRGYNINTNTNEQGNFYLEAPYISMEFVVEATTSDGMRGEKKVIPMEMSGKRIEIIIDDPVSPSIAHPPFSEVNPNNPNHGSDIRRLSMLKKIVTQLESLRICVIHGPHGVGKSTICKEISGLFNGTTHWLGKHDCAPTSPLIPTSESNQPNKFLVVFDDLTKEDYEVRLSLIRGIKCHVLITTRNVQLIQELSGKLGVGNKDRSEWTTELLGFTHEESVEFLTKSVSERLSTEEIDAVHNNTNGIPLILQAVANIINSRNADSLKWLFRNGQINNEELQNKILGLWRNDSLNSNQVNILRFLSRVSCAGTSLEAVEYVAKTWNQSSSVDTEMSSLLQFGFLQKNASIRFPNDELISPHDLIRKHFRSLDDEDCDKDYAVSYGEFIASKFASQEANGGFLQCGFMTLVDGWIVAFMVIFNNRRTWSNDNEEFKRVFSRTSQLLKKILHANIRDPGMAKLTSRRLIEVFKGRYPMQDCRQDIPFAQCLASLPPSFEAADVAWLGSQSENDWARSLAIWASFTHWKSVGKIDQDKKSAIRQNIKQWVSDCWDKLLPQNGKINRLEEQRDSGRESPEMSLAAIIGGMRFLFTYDEILVFLCDPQNFSRIECNILIDLTALVSLKDAGTPSRLIANYGVKCAAASRLVGGVNLRLVCEYCGIPDLSKVIEMEYPDSLLGDISALAHSPNLQTFCARMKVPCDPSHIVSVALD